jgi:hypothetical protein
LAASEVLIGLWLRGLKPKKCLSIVSEWHGALTMRSAANENCSADIERDKARAAALLEATCATCTKLCPRNVMSPALPRRAARQA